MIPARPPTLWVLSLFVLLACAKTPVTGKNVFILTSETEEAQLGKTAYQQILQKEKISSNRTWTDMVNRVADRIAKAANRPNYQWEFKLLESKERNAFCLPGGKIAVYTGIFGVFANEAQLAAVLGHEVAHATARHAGQRITLQFGEEIGFAALTQFLGGTETLEKKILMQALGLGAMVGAVLPFSRAQEGEADYIGEIYMAQAGYDPNASITLWQAMAKEASKAPEFLSTHPLPEKRMEALRQHLPEALGVYQNSPRYGLGQTLAPTVVRAF